MTPQDAIGYAWLLQPLVRKATGAESGPNEAFLQWWVATGRQWYPACQELPASLLARLREPSGRVQVHGLEVPLPRAMAWVLQARPDIRERHGHDILALAGWFFSAGLHEHALLPLVEDSWVHALDRPLRLTDAPQPVARDLSALVPAPTVLMALVWQMHPEELRRAESLDDPRLRSRFMKRFFAQVADSPSLRSVLAPRWAWWLEQDTAAPGARVPLPRWRQLGLARAVGRDHGSATAATTAPAHTDFRARPFGVNLYGFAFGELGIGEDVRMAAQACEAAGIPYRVVNVDPGVQLRKADALLAERVQLARGTEPFAFNLFCMPGFDMVGRVVMREGAQLLKGHCNIGWWPWELPVWPQRWRGAFGLVDEIWAATRFTEAMYGRACKKPVVHMPLAADIGRLQPLSRESLGLPAQRFLFLFVFDANSWLPRKNPQGVLEAFERAYPAGDNSVGLVIKSMNGRPGHPVWEAFKARCARDTRVRLIEQTLGRGHVLGLLQACDAYVSLHRAEGFGRTLAEAMLLGKPVVATDFSGNTDFLMPQTGFPVRWVKRPVGAGEYLHVEPDDGAWWAEPDLAHAAEQLRAARKAAGSARWCKAMARFAAQAFSAHGVGQSMRERLLRLWEEAGSSQPAPASSASGPTS